MKLKISYPIFAFLVVLLASASFSTVYAAPNTNFETGDFFHFSSFQEREDNWNNKFVLFNPINDTDIYRYQENWNDGFTTLNGDLELFLIKPDANLPAFTSPEGPYDHILLVDWEGMSVDPSNRSGGDNFFDAGGSATWENTTHPVENTAGRYEGNDKDGEDWMPVVSNATYLIQMSEMTDSSVYFQEMDWLSQEWDLGSFDGQVPLTSRSVTPMPSMPFTINGAERIIDTNYLTSTFEINYPETFEAWIPFGDPNDPNTAFVDVNATLNIWVYQSFSSYFDATTGMLLEMSEIRNFGFDLKYTNSSMLNEGGGPSPMALSSEMLVSSFSSNVNTIDEASSFYGNTRPGTSGTNRIETGDLLVYDVENDKEWSMDSDVVAGNPDLFGWESYDSSWGDYNSYGEVNFDVYRHEPGFFDAVMFSDGQSEGSWGYDHSGTWFGQDRQDANSSSYGPHPYLDYDYMNFQSTADEEIVHWFETNMWFNDDFLYDDGDRDGWRLNYNRELVMDGPVNDTSYHIDLDSTESVWINGFEHTWFNVQQYRQKYATSWNEQVEIPMFREENGEAWLTVTLTGDARGEQSFYYDNQTGVLVRMEERMEVDLYLNGTGSIQVKDETTGNMITITATFDAAIKIKERFSIMLTEHPNEYLTAEAVDPVDHSTPVDTTPVDTTTSTPADTNTTGEEPPALDLPISVPSVVMGIMAIPVVLRFKKKLR